MPAILHLLSQTADAQTRRLHEMMTNQAGAKFESTAMTLGPGGDFRNVPAAIFRLRHHPADIIHTWGIPALVVAVFTRQRRILFSTDRFLGPRALRWVRTLMNRRPDVLMICPTAGQQRLAVSHGIPRSQCHLIRPGIDLERLRPRDPLLRQQLGLADSDYVLLAPGESTIPSGHDQAVWATGILNVLDPAYKLLLWGRGPRAAFAIELGHRLRQASILRFAEPVLGRTVEFEELLSVADACLITAGGAIPTLPILTTMGAGVPIVSTVTSLLTEHLQDSRTALMVPKRSPRALAQRILDLREAPALQKQITDAARAEVLENFSTAKMREAYRGIVRQVTENRLQSK